jgi:hypothetical protein
LFKERVDILHMPVKVNESNECNPTSPEKPPDEESDGYQPARTAKGNILPAAGKAPLEDAPPPIVESGLGLIRRLKAFALG